MNIMYFSVARFYYHAVLQFPSNTGLLQVVGFQSLVVIWWLVSSPGIGSFVRQLCTGSAMSSPTFSGPCKTLLTKLKVCYKQGCVTFLKSFDFLHFVVRRIQKWLKLMNPKKLEVLEIWESVEVRSMCMYVEMVLDLFPW